MGSRDDGHDSRGREDARKAILARRAKFVAVALTGAGLAGAGACDTPPMVCLKVAPSPRPTPELDAGSDAGSTQEDAGSATKATGSADAGTDAGPGDAIPPRPTVCLEFAEPPQGRPRPAGKAQPKPKPPTPRVCLNMDTVEGDE